MANIVPSDIVNLIDTVLPNSKKIQNEGGTFVLDRGYGGFLKALLNMLDKIDDALLPLSKEDLTCLIMSKCEIINNLEHSLRGRMLELRKTPGYGDDNPVIWIRRLLERCPDVLVPPEVSGLEFIENPKYREILRSDLASVEFLFNNNQWKAAMVIGGSAIEAILCDQLNRKNIKEDITKWHLPELVRKACELGLIKEGTKEEALRAGNYRNLIHPGRAEREKASCTKGTAGIVVAALWLVIEDLEQS